MHANVDPVRESGARRPSGRSRRNWLFPGAVCVAWMALPQGAGAAEFDVADSDEAGLIAAINEANGNGEADVIRLAAGGIYTLTTVEDSTDGPSGLPSISSEIVIEGNGSIIRRSAGIVPHFRIFHVAATGDLRLNDVTVRNGKAIDGGTANQRHGGGIIVLGGALTLNGCAVEDNQAGHSGFSGDMFGNDGGQGGGIYNNAGTLTIDRTTISGNMTGTGEGGTQFGGSGGRGGGIFNSGTLTLTRSTLSGNGTGEGGDGTTGDGGRGGGGGLYNGSNSEANLTSCTLSQNAAGAGGAIMNFGQVFIRGGTIVENSASSAGGAGGISNGADLDMTHTIVANQAAGPDCAGNAPLSLGHNLDSDGTCQLDDTGDASGMDPMLGPLADNGGPTRTHAPLAGSPVIDAGEAEAGELDQRGLRRAFDGDFDGTPRADIGAVEFYDCDEDDAEDATGDSDGDGVPDLCDGCAGEDDLLDTDGDGMEDCVDPCPVDATNDTDGDGVCDSEDSCPADASDDSDGDGVCDSDDVCADGDDGLDGDGDGVPDACDVDAPTGGACCGGGLPAAALLSLLMGGRWKMSRRGVNRMRAMRKTSGGRGRMAVAMAIGLWAAQPAAAQFIITQIIDGTGAGGVNMLEEPNAIAVDAAGNVYVTGQTSDNAFKIAPDGTVTLIIDASGDGAGHMLDGPSGIAVDADGNVYVSGFNSDNAFFIRPDGVIVQVIDSTGDGGGNMLDGPCGIAVDADGNVYVTGQVSDNAFKIRPGGFSPIVTEIIDANGDGGGNMLDGPCGVAVDGDGNVFVAGGGIDSTFRIEPDGTITQIIDLNGDGAGQALDGSEGAATDAAGNAYVVGGKSDNAFRITPQGEIEAVIDSTGDGAGNGLDDPIGIAADGDGRAYITGSTSNNVFEILADGTVRQILDSTGDGAGHGLDSPAGIAASSAGDVYVTGLVSDNAFRLARDGDGDGVADGEDNCREESNADQADADGDGAGDVCDELVGDDNAGDTDGDGVADDVDNCPNAANADQADADQDGLGDACAPTSETGACCGGGLPAALPLLMLAARRRAAGRVRRRRN